MFKFLPKPPIPGLYYVILIFIVIYTIVGLLLNWLNNAHQAQVGELHQVGERQQIVAISVDASRTSAQGLPTADGP
jgi:hypothetical protein